MVDKFRDMNEDFLGVEGYQILINKSEEFFHDMKNLLSTILGIAQLTMLHTESIGTMDDLEIIMKSAIECRDGLDRFYNLVKGSNIKEKEFIILDDLVVEVLNMVKHKCNTSNNNGFKITLEYKSNSRAIIFCNPYEIKQVLLNIILNGIDAMDYTGGVLEVNLLEIDRKAIVTISDSGTGILDEDLLRIFEPYYTTKKTKGTGLGLRISKNIIEEHLGKIRVESKLGVGTKFTIHLPIMGRC